MSNTEGKYVPIDVIAEFLSLKPNTLRTWVRMGFIPKSTYIKVGNTYRFSIPEVVKALKQDDPAVLDTSLLARKKEALDALPEYVDEVSGIDNDEFSEIAHTATNFDDNEDL
tara:strand:- start:345 stop:680 length:336 start_codon:yes stop_codon:yes gene_type:complete